MNIEKFLDLVPIRIQCYDPVANAYRHLIPLVDFINVLEENNLHILSSDEMCELQYTSENEEEMRKMPLYDGFFKRRDAKKRKSDVHTPGENVKVF